MTGHIVAVLPELCLLVGAVGALLVGLWLPRRRQWIVHAVAALAVTTALVLAAVAATRSDTTAFHDAYAVDSALHVARLTAGAVTLLVLAMSRGQVRAHPRETEFATLLLLAALGAILLAGANDLLVLAVAYLLATVPLYALVGFGKDAAGTEAALKLALFGAFLGITMLAGVTVLFGLGGHTVYPGLRAGLSGAPRAAVLVALLMTSSGLLFKAAAVPGHFWLPDVVEGTPTGVAAFVTTVPKIGALVAVYRLVTDVVPDGASLLFALVAAASMTLGNLAAFRQDDVRRLLGYSTVSQAGYLLIAPAAATAELALPALLYYLAAYAVANVGAFAVVAATGGAHRIGDYAGAFRTAPVSSLALVVCLLGLVGTPPTAVFVGKLAVFAAGVDAGLVWLVVLAVLNTVASVFYYLRWITPLFAEPAGRPGEPDRWASAVLVSAATLTLVVGVGGGVVLGTLTA